MVIFELLTPYLFEPTPGKINFEQTFWAGVVSVHFGALGVWACRFFE